MYLPLQQHRRNTIWSNADAGFKTKLAALGSGLLLLSFGIAMSLNSSIKSALDFSVFAAAGCCLLLYLNPHSKWSIDASIKK